MLKSTLCLLLKLLRAKLHNLVHWAFYVFKAAKYYKNDVFWSYLQQLVAGFVFC